MDHPPQHKSRLYWINDLTTPLAKLQENPFLLVLKVFFFFWFWNVISLR